MTCFESLEVGQVFTIGGLEVDERQATEFAEQYDPRFVPRPGVAYVHRGPEISPWQAAAFSWRLLSNLAANPPIEQASFSRPQDLNWQNAVSVGDVLRLEVEVVEIFPPHWRSPDHGLARVKVTLVTSGAAGFGAWGDDDGEQVDDVALTYTALMQARRRDKVAPFHGSA